MNARLGLLLMACGALHTLVGLVFGWPLWFDMLAAGLLGQGGPDILLALDQGIEAAARVNAGRTLLFWFFFAGVALFVAGQVVRKVEAPLGAWVGYELIAMGAVGVLMVPLSGFWLLIGVGGWQVRGARARMQA